MPVTITPYVHEANSFDPQPPPGVNNAKSLLHRSLTGKVPAEFELYQSSWGHGEVPLERPIIPNTNGFVNTLITAWNQHHHLTIRPDDVWIAIVTQFSLYVNSHAEELRHLFVAHKGKKELRIDYNPWVPETFDFRVFALDMGRYLEKVVVDAELRSWIVPDFTTTEKNDIVVASIIMMGTLQKYFDYTFGVTCGFPSVTLLGEKSDYEAILQRVDKLEQYGDEAKLFASALRPVIKRFVASFDDPKASDVVKFWQTCCHVDASLCGVTLYTGWITAFCFWDEDGKSLYGRRGFSTWRKAEKEAAQSDYGRRGFSKRRKAEKEAAQEDPSELQPLVDRMDVESLVLDGVRYSALDHKDIPPSWTKVPVKLEHSRGQGMAEMYAGLMGIGVHARGASSRFVPDNDISEEGEGTRRTDVPSNADAPLDSVAPVVAWWITEDLAPKRREYEEKLKREQLTVYLDMARKRTWSDNKQWVKDMEEKLAELNKSWKEREASKKVRAAEEGREREAARAEYEASLVGKVNEANEAATGE